MLTSGVFKLSRKIEYSLMALKYLWQNPAGMARLSDYISVRELSDELKIPFDTTSKVLQLMQAKGLVEAERGNQGGYRLSSNLGEVSFLQLCEWIEKKRMGLGHQCESGSCEYIKSCNVEASINNLSELVSNFFSKFSIEDVLDARVPIKFKGIL
jgi:Rrf2 family nitric oxide-sensitive transcriptional repressor